MQIHNNICLYNAFRSLQASTCETGHRIRFGCNAIRCACDALRARCVASAMRCACDALQCEIERAGEETTDLCDWCVQSGLPCRAVP